MLAEAFLQQLLQSLVRESQRLISLGLSISGWSVLAQTVLSWLWCEAGFSLVSWLFRLLVRTVLTLFKSCILAKQSPFFTSGRCWPPFVGCGPGVWFSESLRAWGSARHREHRAPRCCVSSPSLRAALLSSVLWTPGGSSGCRGM